MVVEDVERVQGLLGPEGGGLLEVAFVPQKAEELGAGGFAEG